MGHRDDPRLPRTILRFIRLLYRSRRVSSTKNAAELRLPSDPVRSIRIVYEFVRTRIEDSSKTQWKSQ